MRKKHYFLLLITAMIATSLAMMSVPVTSSPSPVTFDAKYYYLPDGYVDGVNPDEFVIVDVFINASELEYHSPEGIVGWGLRVRVNPDVLTPVGVMGGEAGYFLKDYQKSKYPFGYSVSLVATPSEDGSYMDIAEMIVKTPANGAGGTGLLVTLGFISHSLTAYSEIILEVHPDGNYMTPDNTWHAVTMINGHYNPPEVPEFPLGSVAPIALIAAIAYIWWVTKRKTREAM